MAVQERRQTVRRKSDREMLNQLNRLGQKGGAASTGDADEDKRKRRMRRHVIRRHVQVDIHALMKHKAGFSDEESIDHIKIEGRLLDLSEDGASIYTRQPFETGQELRMTLHLGSKTIETNSVIRWVKSVPEKNGFASGLRFVNLGEKDSRRLAKSLAKIEASSGL